MCKGLKREEELKREKKGGLHVSFVRERKGISNYCSLTFLVVGTMGLKEERKKSCVMHELKAK
jgi:hypothetical protein